MSLFNSTSATAPHLNQIAPAAAMPGGQVELAGTHLDPADHRLPHASIGDVFAPVTLSRPTVSHHLNLLRRAGLIRVRKHGREMYYRLNKEPIVATLQGLLDSLTCC